MERFILDTSVFTNPDIFSQFGKDSLEAIRNFLDLARRCDAEFFMPVSVWEELRLVKQLDDLVADYESVVKIRSPRRYNLLVPSGILYEFIEEIRGRINRGLRIAEDYARLAGRTMEDEHMGKIINKLRERYREALRQGILDSREDADVLMLSFELDATLVSADEGLRHWADRVGIKIITSSYLRKIMEHLIKDHASGQELAE